VAAGWFLLWHTALKHLPPIQEALGLRKPLKPLKHEKQKEIDEMRRQHAQYRAAFDGSDASRRRREGRPAGLPP
jgi:hypothetical protein